METKRDINWSFNWNTYPFILKSFECQGRSFSFQHFYERETGIFFKIRTSALIEAQKSAKTIAQNFPGVTVETTYVNKANIVTIHVPEQLSALCYAEVFTNEGIPFKNHLLANHRDKLLEICKPWIASPHKSYLVVSPNGLFDDYHDPLAQCYFKTFGMANLEKISQCYGFALAVADILKNETSATHKYVVSKMELETNRGLAFVMELECITKPPVLKKW